MTVTSSPAAPRATLRALGVVGALFAVYLLAAGSVYERVYLRQHGWGVGAVTAGALLVLEVIALLLPAALLAALCRRRGWPRAAVGLTLGWLIAAASLFRADAIMVSTFAQHVYGALVWNCLKSSVQGADPAALAMTGKQVALYALEAAAIFGLPWPAFLAARRFFRRRADSAAPFWLRRGALALGALALAACLLAWASSRFGPNREALLAIQHGFLVPLSLGPEGKPPREAAERAAAAFRRETGSGAAEPAWLGPLEITAPARRRPNIVMIFTESLRADAFTPETTPELWRFSRDAARATRHYADGNTTYLSLFSIIYGQTPMDWDLARLKRVAPPPLAALRRSGYRLHLAASCSMEWWGMDRVVFPRSLFDTWVDRKGRPVEDDLATTADALRVIDGAGREPFFLFVFFYSTHWSYYYPPEGERFRPCLQNLECHVGPELAERREEVRNRYRNASLFVDRCCGRILARLAEKGRLDETVVVFGSDHGESFYETGTFLHGNSLAEQEIRTPLCVRWPGRAGREVAGYTQHQDIFPSIFKYMELESPQLAALSGRPELLDGAGREWVAVGAAKEGAPERWMLRDERRRMIFRLAPAKNEFELESWRDGSGAEGRPVPVGDDPAEIERLGGALDGWMRDAGVGWMRRSAAREGFWGRPAREHL